MPNYRVTCINNEHLEHILEVGKEYICTICKEPRHRLSNTSHLHIRKPDGNILCISHIRFKMLGVEGSVSDENIHN